MDAKQKGKRKLGYALTDEHVDYICHEIAEFRGANAIRLTTNCMEKFPDYPPGLVGDARQKWWAQHLYKNFTRDHYGNVFDTCNYKDRIAALREAWRAGTREAVPIANRRARGEGLQHALAGAMRQDNFRDAAYILSLAEREFGASEIDGQGDFTINTVPHPATLATNGAD